MSDWSEHLTTMQRALGELNWLLPDAKWGPAKEKAILIEQCARSLITLVTRHQEELDNLARGNPNAQVLTLKQIFAHIGTPVGYETDAVGTTGPKATVSKT